MYLYLPNTGYSSRSKNKKGRREEGIGDGKFGKGGFGGITLCIVELREADFADFFYQTGFCVVCLYMSSEAAMDGGRSAPFCELMSLKR